VRTRRQPHHPSLRTALALLICTLGACGGGSVTPVEAEPVVVVTPPVTAPVTVPVTTPVTVPTPDALPGWRLVWSDEFSTDGLPDPSKWTYDTERNATGWFNNELQYYARARPENARVEGGHLIITARQERLTSASDYGGQAYTSARLLTRGLASWTNGFFEVRAKLPCARGSWPAIWMLGTGGAWPDDGEIDIMEQTGQNKTEVLGTVHTRAYNYFNGSLGPGQGKKTTLNDACTAFHNYQLTWTADQLSIGVDNTVYFEFTNPKTGDTTRWPFDQPQFLLLNLAVGGDLGGAVDNASLPAELVVDHVRVYQR
jgi:beta-glucanase (GH16 family)